MYKPEEVENLIKLSVKLCIVRHQAYFLWITARWQLVTALKQPIHVFGDHFTRLGVVGATRRIHLLPTVHKGTEGFADRIAQLLVRLKSTRPNIIDLLLKLEQVNDHIGLPFLVKHDALTLLDDILFKCRLQFESKVSPVKQAI